MFSDIKINTYPTFNLNFLIDINSIIGAYRPESVVNQRLNRDFTVCLCS